VKIPQKRDRPKTKEIIADKDYGAADLRSKLRQRGVRAIIPEKRLPPGRKRRKNGYTIVFINTLIRKELQPSNSLDGSKNIDKLPTDLRSLA
jgi:hypothetical protein